MRWRMTAAAMLMLLGSLGSYVAPASAQTASPPGDPEGARRELRTTLEARSAGEVTVDVDATTGAVTFVGTDPGSPLTSPTEASGDPEAAAAAFVREFGPLFGADDPASDLDQVAVDPLITGRGGDGGGVNVVYHQVVDAVPVVGGELRVQVDADGNVRSAIGELAPDADVPTTPAITADTAAAAAVRAIAATESIDPADLSASAPETWVYAPDLLGGQALGGPRLVWRLEVTGPGTDEPVRELVLIDAATGLVDLHFSQLTTGRNRGVCNRSNVAQPAPNCTGAFVRSEGQGATGDAEVDRAYDYTGNTYDFYNSRFGRDSIDGLGMPLRSEVRYCKIGGTCPLVNAFWNGSQMTYGDGWAQADDVVAHELTHGVTEFTSGLFYYFQSGAISESLSDIFGEYVDLTNGLGNDVVGVRWVIGEESPIGGVRYLADPTIFGHPDRMTDEHYVCCSGDNGGVHTNSGVGNKAAFLITDGGTFNGRTVAGLGIAKAARVYYQAMTTRLGSASDYADLGRALPQACLDLLGTAGIGLGDCANVQQAVDAVEMLTEPSIAPTPGADGCANQAVTVTLFSDDLENPSSGRWAVSPATGNRWAYPQNPNGYPVPGFNATYATSGRTNFFAPNFPTASDTRITQTADVHLGQNSLLLFNHAYSYVYPQDGGTVEYSIDGGTTWFDAQTMFDSNGYNGSIFGTGPPHNGFTSYTNGYITSRVNLIDLAGQDIRFRFRSTTDSSDAGIGWFIDDIRIISCQPPTARPDAHLRTGATGSWVGADIYNTTASGQSRSTTVAAGGSATFYVRLQNDGNLPDTLELSGPGQESAWRVKYYDGTTDITSQVLAGTWTTGTLPPGDKRTVKVVVTARPAAAAGATKVLKLKAISTLAPTTRDVVKATVTRR